MTKQELHQLHLITGRLELLQHRLGADRVNDSEKQRRIAEAIAKAKDSCLVAIREAESQGTEI